MPLDPTPVPTGPEFIVEAATANYFQFNPAAAALAGGGFVTVGQKSDPAATSAKAKYFSSDVYAQFYAADGTPAGGEFRVNVYQTDHQGSPRTAALVDGGFAVTWESTEPGKMNTLDVHTRRFAADGTPIGDEVRVHDVLGGSQDDPVIAATADGGFVVAWAGFGPPGIGGHGIYARRFGADGALAGDEVRADTPSGDFRGFPEITVLEGGGFVVAWVQTDPSGAGNADVYARRFGADGMPAGDEFRVHALPEDAQGNPKVVGLADGGFVVTWQAAAAEPGQSSSLDDYNVYARRFAADGAPVGDEFRVHDAADGYQANLGAWAAGDGGFAVTWYDGDLQKANGLGIYARLFGAPGLPGPPTAPNKVGIAATASPEAEGGAGAGAVFTFDVTLDATSSAPRSVRWQVEGRGPRAADAADFEGGALPGGEIVFAAGETRKAVTVRVVGDAFVEADEGFAVSLLSPSGGLAVGDDGSAAATILDDDRPASAPPEHAAQVARLYDAALDRLPDRDGFAFWVGALGDGGALSAPADGFLRSPEIAARFGDAAADDGAFVERLYRNVLGREGEAEGKAFWGGSLGGGCSRAEVLAAFSESAEHVALAAAVFGDGAGTLFG